MKEYKTCSKCVQTKPISEFGKRDASRDGLQGHCNACLVKKQQKYYKKHKQRVLDRAKRRYDSNPEKHRETTRKWREKNSDKMVEYHRKWHESQDRFIISLQNSARHAKKNGYVACIATADEIRDLFTGFCAICGVEETGKKLVLDHSHETGEARGWLCRACNSAIGFLGDSEENLVNALHYLMNHQSQKKGHNHDNRF